MKRGNCNIYFVRLFVVSFLVLSLLFDISNATAQDNCEITKNQGQGYSTGIKSVIDNGNNSFTIQLRVKTNGSTVDGNKAMARYSVEAAPGTYSNVSVTVISGNLNYKNVDLGPSLAGDPFTGFRITGTAGFGNGSPGEFLVTYTLSRGLQNQRMLIKAGSDLLIISFKIENFQAVLDCLNPNIFPYYTPPSGGKLISIIGPELNSLYNFFTAGGTPKTDDIFQIFGSDVLIEISVLDGMYTSLLNLLKTSYGLYDVEDDVNQAIITGKIPIANLISLNSLGTYINYVRPVFPAIPTSGIVTSLGDLSMHSDFARSGFSLQGEGVKVGVISDSYNTLIGNPAQDDVQKGDLPGPGNPVNSNPVEVLREYPYGSRTDEGRAMLQIIHDIAPKANLAFRTGYINAPDFAKGIDELKDAGCSIIVDDITYITQPFLSDGIIAQAVNKVKSEGVTYFSAAGNYGNKSYESNFNAGIAPVGISGVAHNFAGSSGNDIYQNVSLAEGNYTIVLQWDDGSGAEKTNTDLDIYLTSNSGNTLFGFNRNNIGGQPIEVLPFTVASGGAQTNIMVVNAAGSNNVFFKYVVFRGNLTFNEYATGSSTLVGQSNSEGAIAVGAVLYSNTPAFGVDPPTVASFSSVGGTPVNGIFRNKPEICAPNGVNTTVDMGGVNIDGDQFPNFFGTSAAAPHAAAVAALIVEARSKFYNSAISPDELKALLQSTAIDMNTPGFDYSTGFGLIQADAALLHIANPSPQITELSFDTTLIPGVEPVPVSLKGKYLTPESEIYFNGEPLTTTTINQGDSLLTATIPVFSNLFPKIQAYNAPLTQTNGSDGGLSNPLYFSTKDKILIEINDTHKKYGEVLPNFTANYSRVSINGSVSLDDAGLTAAETERIKSIGFETVANSLSNVGFWEINPASDDALNPLSGIQPTDSLDMALLKKFDFVFKRGLLSIEKMDLLVKPRDMTLTYGEDLAGVQFDYIFNNDTINPGNQVSISSVDSIEIISQLKETHAAALVNSIALVNAAALVNELGQPLLDATALVNKSFMISDATALVNSVALVNGAFIDAQALLEATALVNSVALVNSMALVNAMALVNGTALVNATPLVNSIALVNSMALVNSTTINTNSNSGAIIILSKDDIDILSGVAPGSVVLRSVNLVTGNTVGKHLIVPGSLISNNFNVVYGLGELTIIPAVATVTFAPEGLEKVYDGMPTSPAITTEPKDLTVDLTFNGNTTIPLKAGIYQVIATVNNPNYIGSSTATFVIKPVAADVKADDKVMKQGDSLPLFTATFSGLISGENTSVINSLTFSISQNYLGLAGSYQIIPYATADNYLFSPFNGTLYVNPYGSGTKNVKTSLSCVESIPMDSNGFTFIANFAYENPNSTPVYVAIGSDNLVSGSGKFENANQPVLFLPGIHTWQARFNGSKITWAVSTYSGTHKTSTASYASSSSNKCTSKTIQKSATIPSQQLKAFPNPTTDKVYITNGDESIQPNNVVVSDVAGRLIHAKIYQLTETTMQVDFSGLEQGIYFIKLNTVGDQKIVRIIKQ